MQFIANLTGWSLHVILVVMVLSKHQTTDMPRVGHKVSSVLADMGKLDR